jgi:lysophospholipase L1-like esterase
MLVAAVWLLSFAAGRVAVQTPGAARDHWVGTWSTALVERGPLDPNAAPTRNPLPLTSFNDQTIRQIVRVSVGGDRVRVVLSNAFGRAPLAVGAAHVALRREGAAIGPGAARPLTFSGRTSVMIPAGAVMFSDPVNLTVAPLQDLAIDVYLPTEVSAEQSPLTVHTGGGALQTNYVSPSGNHSGAAVMPVSATTLSWYFLARVETATATQRGAIVAFGDSITDGTRSTIDANNRWPDHLARRLKDSGMTIGVLNASISGNRLLTPGAGDSALARFDRDVLAQTGVTHVVVLEGINDIGLTRPMPTALDLITAHRQLIQRAHAHGLKIYGATLLPFEGSSLSNPSYRYWTPEGEALRQALNEWIRTSKEYDGVIDFDAVVKDPDQPTRMFPKFASPDMLHPSDAGYEAMGNSVRLALFGPSQN